MIEATSLFEASFNDVGWMRDCYFNEDSRNTACLHVRWGSGMGQKPASGDHDCVSHPSQLTTNASMNEISDLMDDISDHSLVMGPHMSSVM